MKTKLNNGKKQGFFILVLSVMILWQVSAAGTAPQLSLRRFAIIIGSNNGGTERVMLRYATKDAVSFSRVMKEMGAVSDNDIVLLLDPDINRIFSAFRTIREKVTAYEKSGDAARTGRTELMVYYSGHSDEEGILLNGQRLGYKQLRDEISGVNADVRVAILDSCSSGAFTRTKGVIKQPPFLIDSSSTMEGYAFLTSSSDDEAAQESDTLGASFFTHYFVSGLRGAADSTADGLVTLNEAYSYAFRETLARTEKTQYGPQHPEYDIQLTGTGDLVLTDLRETSASLLLADELEGTLFIRDASGNLVAELRKTAGHTIEVGLEPGKYLIIMEKDGELFKGSVQLKKNDRKYLAGDLFDKMKNEKTIARGDDDTVITDEDSADESIIVPFHYSLLPSFSAENVINSNYAFTLSLNLFIGIAANVIGCQVSGLGNFVNYNATGVTAASIFNAVSGNMTGYQTSGVGNFVNGNLAGMQSAGVFNQVSGDAGYVQLAGVVNLAGGKFTGFQSSGCINLLDSDMTGFQLGGVANYSGSLVGAQTAGVINISGGSTLGTQIAGVSNYAGSLAGAQIAGVINIAGDSTGMQLSLINVANDVTGVQIGIVNIADTFRGGLPIGLINISGDGYYSLDVWQSFMPVTSLADSVPGFTNLSLRFGTKFIYTLLTCGIDFDSESLPWSTGGGFGVHIPLGPLSIDTDISYNTLYTDSGKGYVSAGFPRIRTLLGIDLGKYFILTGGCSFDISIPANGFVYNVDAPWEIILPLSSDIVKINPEPFAGISLRL